MATKYINFDLNVDGDGTLATPWNGDDWLAISAGIDSGDTVLVAGTIYGNRLYSDGTDNRLNLVGTQNVVVKQWPDMDRAVFRGDQNVGYHLGRGDFSASLVGDNGYEVVLTSVQPEAFGNHAISYVLSDYEPEELSLTNPVMPDPFYWVPEATGGDFATQRTNIGNGEVAWAYDTATDTLVLSNSITNPSFKFHNSAGDTKELFEIASADNLLLQGITFAMIANPVGTGGENRMLQLQAGREVNVDDCHFLWGSDDMIAFVNGQNRNLRVTNSRYVFPGRDGGGGVWFTQGDGNFVRGLNNGLENCLYVLTQPTETDGTTRFDSFNGGRGPLWALHPGVTETTDEFVHRSRRLRTIRDARGEDATEQHNLLDSGDANSVDPTTLDIPSESLFKQRILDTEDAYLTTINPETTWVERCVLRVQQDNNSNSLFTVAGNASSINNTVTVFKNCVLIANGNARYMFDAAGRAPATADTNNIMVLWNCLCISVNKFGGSNPQSWFRGPNGSEADAGTWHYRIHGSVFWSINGDMNLMNVTQGGGDPTAESVNRLRGLDGDPLSEPSMWFAGTQPNRWITSQNATDSEAGWNAVHNTQGMSIVDGSDPGLVYNQTSLAFDRITRGNVLPLDIFNREFSHGNVPLEGLSLVWDEISRKSRIDTWGPFRDGPVQSAATEPTTRFLNNWVTQVSENDARAEEGITTTVQDNAEPGFFINEETYPTRVLDTNTEEMLSQPFVSGPVTVELFRVAEGQEIRYTTNNKNPTSKSKLYSGPIVVNRNLTGSDNTVIKARVFDTNNAGLKTRTLVLRFRVV